MQRARLSAWEMLVEAETPQAWLMNAHAGVALIKWRRGVDELLREEKELVHRQQQLFTRAALSPGG